MANYNFFNNKSLKEIVIDMNSRYSGMADKDSQTLIKDISSALQRELGKGAYAGFYKDFTDKDITKLHLFANIYKKDLDRVKKAITTVTASLNRKYYGAGLTKDEQKKVDDLERTQKDGGVLTAQKDAELQKLYDVSKIFSDDALSIAPAKLYKYQVPLSGNKARSAAEQFLKSTNTGRLISTTTPDVYTLETFQKIGKKFSAKNRGLYEQVLGSAAFEQSDAENARREQIAQAKEQTRIAKEQEKAAKDKSKAEQDADRIARYNINAQHKGYQAGLTGKEYFYTGKYKSAYDAGYNAGDAERQGFEAGSTGKPNEYKGAYVADYNKGFSKGSGEAEKQATIDAEKSADEDARETENFRKAILRGLRIPGAVLTAVAVGIQTLIALAKGLLQASLERAQSGLTGKGSGMSEAQTTFLNDLAKNTGVLDKGTFEKFGSEVASKFGDILNLDKKGMGQIYLAVPGMSNKTVELAQGKISTMQFMEAYTKGILARKDISTMVKAQRTRNLFGDEAAKWITFAEENGFTNFADFGLQYGVNAGMGVYADKSAYATGATGEKASAKWNQFTNAFNKAAALATTAYKAEHELKRGDWNGENVKELTRLGSVATDDITTRGFTNTLNVNIRTNDGNTTQTVIDLTKQTEKTQYIQAGN